MDGNIGILRCVKILKIHRVAKKGNSSFYPWWNTFGVKERKARSQPQPHYVLFFPQSFVSIAIRLDLASYVETRCSPSSYTSLLRD